MFMDGKAWRFLWRRRRAFAADPDEVVFGRLFRRLFFWYTSLLVIMIVLSVLSIGTTVPWLVFVSTEHGLSGQVSQLARTWQGKPNEVCPSALPGQGYMLACYDAHGRLLKSLGVKGGVEKHFLDNALALAALHESSSVEDALDETGTEPAQFSFVFLAAGQVRIVRQAFSVHKLGSNEILGVVQLGITPAEALNRRAAIVNIFLAGMILAIVLGAPLGGWYMARKALQPARLAFQRQRDFISNVSHELGTPLALLRANADVLLRSRSRLAKEDAELLEDIVAETIYMDKMTSNMLLLARMDAGQLRLERDVLDLGQIAEGVVRRTQAAAERAGITLVFQQEEATYALGDCALLEQAMLILLDNALKYTPSGGKVNVYTFMEDGRACLRVNDTGIGIAPADLSRLGERFYRVDKARSREAGGHGLGLSIARGIVAVHKGELLLTSGLGKGTSATLRLPAARILLSEDKHTESENC